MINNIFKLVFLFLFASCASQESIDLENAESKAKSVKKTLSAAVPKLRYCYEKELNEYEDVKDSIFNFNIDVAGVDGSPQDVKITNKKKFQDKLATCLKQVVYSLKFYKAKDGKDYSIKQPINFYPRSK